MEKKKLIYDVVLKSRKALRKLKRTQNKKQLTSPIGLSPLGKMRSRQERKAMAKALKIPFTPKYNGLVFKKLWKKDEEGKTYFEYQEVK